MYLDYVRWTLRVPSPLSPHWRPVDIPRRLVGTFKQPAAIDERHKMPAQPALRLDVLLDHRNRLERHARSEFFACGRVDPLRRRLLESDHATGDVPARPVDLVIPPGQQNATRIVRDPQIDVHH